MNPYLADTGVICHVFMTIVRMRSKSEPFHEENCGHGYILKRYYKYIYSITQ